MITNFKLSCEGCNYFTNSQQHYNRHVITKKHNKFIENNNIFISVCDICKNKFTTNSGMWRHKKTCKKVEIVTEEMRQDINEIKNIVSNITPSTTTNIQNNNNKNEFNVNVYLNENMTRATSFMDLMGSIMIDRSYLEKVSKNGYVSTICGMVTEKIEEIPITQRPIYCIKNEDDNQEIVHVCHNNVWKKETELEWTSNIYKYYNGDEDDDEAEKNIIFKSLKQMEDNVMEQIKALYRNSVRIKIIEHQTESEINFVANKIKIIRCLIEHIKLDKKDLMKIINDTYKIHPIETPDTIETHETIETH